jgi:hypothetical protein
MASPTSTDLFGKTENVSFYSNATDHLVSSNFSSERCGAMDQHYIEVGDND